MGQAVSLRGMLCCIRDRDRRLPCTQIFLFLQMITYELHYEDKKIDKRNRKRHSELLRGLFSAATHSVAACSKDRAQQIANYRLLRNSRYSEDLLNSSMQNQCAENVKDRVVLCLHDTTEANFFNHVNRIKDFEGLGPIDASPKNGVGFKMHTSLVIDANIGYPYGFSNVLLWNRPFEDKEPKPYKGRLPMCQKESNKWLIGCDKSNETLVLAKKVIHIQDREGDIYEQISAFSEDERTFHIIRSRFNRTTTDGIDIESAIAQSPVISEYLLNIDADSHSNRGKRTAIMSLTVAKIKVKRPVHVDKKFPKESKYIYLVDTKEMNPPKGVEPLHWRLITNCRVEQVEQAMQVIKWYQMRWEIENIFKILKKENFNIENSELETGLGLRKFSLNILQCCLLLYQLVFFRENIPEEETFESMCAFSEEEHSCLERLNETLEGNTEAQKNPYKPRTREWAVWILARLGGWKGYKSQRKAGPTIILRGIERFYNLMEGWSLHRDLCTR